MQNLRRNPLDPEEAAEDKSRTKKEPSKPNREDEPNRVRLDVERIGKVLVFRLYPTSLR